MTAESWMGMNIVDAASYQSYREAMSPILKTYGGGFRYDFVVSEVLKSEAEHLINRVFAIYFPDEATRERFFADPHYLEIKKKYFDQAVAGRTTLAKLER